MAWCAASGSVKFGQDDHELLGLVTTEHSSITHELHKGRRKRARHYTVKDEVDDDDVSDELSNASEKKRRLTTEQVNFLEMSFNMDLKLEPERKFLIAKQLGIRPRQVAIWFQNRRARWKNKQVEQDYEALKAKYEALVKEKESMMQEHDAALKENKKLQAEVSHLTELFKSQENYSVRNGFVAVPERGLVQEQQTIRSEVTSATKSFEDQSEVQDSGQSCPTSEAVAGSKLNEACFEEPNPLFTYAEGAPFVFADDFFGSFPYCVQFATTGHFQDDGCNILFNYEDQFMR